MPPSVGCSPPEAFRFAPSLPLRFACGPLPLTCPRVGTGPGGDSRPHLRHCKIAIPLIVGGIAIVFVIENKKLYQTMAKIVIEAYNPRMLLNNVYSGRHMEKRLVENIAYLWFLHIILESTLQWSGCAAMRQTAATELRS